MYVSFQLVRDKDFNGKEEAMKEDREAFAEKMRQKGITLRYHQANIYETSSGHRVGITCSTNHTRRCSKDGWASWNSSMKYESFDIAVLRCQLDSKRHPKNFIDICLPKQFIDEHRDHIRRAKKTGKMLFKISQANGKYGKYMLLVAGEKVDVSEFVEKYDPLR